MRCAFLILLLSITAISCVAAADDNNSKSIHDNNSLTIKNINDSVVNNHSQSALDVQKLIEMNKKLSNENKQLKGENAQLHKHLDRVVNRAQNDLERERDITADQQEIIGEQEEIITNQEKEIHNLTRTLKQTQAKVENLTRTVDEQRLEIQKLKEKEATENRMKFLNSVMIIITATFIVSVLTICMPITGGLAIVGIGMTLLCTAKVLNKIWHPSNSTRDLA